MIVNELIHSYKTDVDSPYYGFRLRVCTRAHYVELCKAISREIGHMDLADVKARQLLHWHEQYLQSGKISMGHSVMGMLRILTGFGSTILEDPQCVRISDVLGKMRFKMAKPRIERLTADQAVMVRAEAHRVNRRSMALAQAFQFELMLRQRDVLGEWMPVAEPVPSDLIVGEIKWARGLRWDEIDENFILTHVTSKRQKPITVDLKLASMVIQELMLWFGAMDRKRMPESGPVIISERTGLPWHAQEFRRYWRKIATNVGISPLVKNMDTRSGAITEATDAGIPLETIRHASTHAQIQMVERYSRGSTEKIESVMKLRQASRGSK